MYLLQVFDLQGGVKHCIFNAKMLPVGRMLHKLVTVDVSTSLHQVFELQCSSKIEHLDPVHYYQIEHYMGCRILSFYFIFLTGPKCCKKYLVTVDVLTSLHWVFWLPHSSKIGHPDPVHYY